MADFSMLLAGFPVPFAGNYRVVATPQIAPARARFASPAPATGPAA